MLAIGLAFSSSSWASFSECLTHFPESKPPSIQEELLPSDLRELCFDGFAILYSGESKTAVYSVARLNAEKIKKAKSIKRVDRFYPEARLPAAYRATLADYAKSGFDRGHLFPAGDASSDEIMAQSFSLANIVPQNPSHNRGPWAKSVEQAVRKYVERAKGDVFVFTGPIYSGSEGALGKSKVKIPDSLYKFVYDREKHTAWGYILPNDAQSKVSGVYSYEEMVAAIGIHFLDPR